eukprot:5175137-Prymnesium_polylepis.2
MVPVVGGNPTAASRRGVLGQKGAARHTLGALAGVGRAPACKAGSVGSHAGSDRELLVAHRQHQMVQRVDILHLERDAALGRQEEAARVERDVSAAGLLAEDLPRRRVDARKVKLDE